MVSLELFAITHKVRKFRMDCNSERVILSPRTDFFSGKRAVVYHLPKKSGNFGWNVNGKPEQKFYRENGFLEM